MAGSVFHRAMQRRAERAPSLDAGHINLVPLIDILTSIVFFSLLTYTGAEMANLTSFDMTLPPVVVTGQQATASAPDNTLTLLLAVRVSHDGFRVEHSGNGGFRQQIAGVSDVSLDSLQSLVTQIKQQYPQNSDVLVVPDDDVAYDDIVHVLARLKAAQYTGISLGSRARGAPITAGL